MKSPRAKATPSQIIKRLERKLEDEKIKNMVLNEAIKLSDKQYGRIIRKKFFPKQSDILKRQKGLKSSHACRLFGISRQSVYQQESRDSKRIKELY